MSLNKTKLAKALAIAMAGSVLSVASISDASASATTMYNLTTSNGDDNSTNTTICAPCIGGTDGWVYGFTNPSNGTDTSVASWAGTSGTNKTPFGYTGAHLNWALQMSSFDSAEISSQDSLTRYGVAADIDTAKGAWSDNTTPVAGAGGWRHDLDFGLFKSDVGGTITLSAQTITPSAFSFGFTIIKGMNSSPTYNHHGSWNNGNNSNGLTNLSLPAGGTNFDPDGAGPLTGLDAIVAYSVGGANPVNLNTIIFNADAGQVYTIVIGGYRNGKYIETIDGYKLNVSSVSNVPVPGAVWLFGSAISGLVGFNRRRSKAST
jgi:hypothetical protein